MTNLRVVIKYLRRHTGSIYKRHRVKRLNQKEKELERKEIDSDGERAKEKETILPR